jgi:hypothetical protein
MLIWRTQFCRNAHHKRNNDSALLPPPAQPRVDAAMRCRSRCQYPFSYPRGSSLSRLSRRSSLPFLRNCMRENFRITPVFTIPPVRRVMDPADVTSDGNCFRRGYVILPTCLPLPNYLFGSVKTNIIHLDLTGGVQPRLPAERGRLGR